MATQKVTIFRYGHYVNEVKREELRKWLINNVPYDFGKGVIPPDTDEREAYHIALRKGFDFKFFTEQ